MPSSSKILPSETILEALSRVDTFEDLGRAVELMCDTAMSYRRDDASLFLKRVGEVLAEPERFGLADVPEPDWQWFGRVVWAAYSNQGPFSAKP